MPQKMPVIAAFSRLRWRLTIVVTAITWSGSVAWRMPRKNPTATIERKLIMGALPLLACCWRAQPVEAGRQKTQVFVHSDSGLGGELEDRHARAHCLHI